MAKRAFIPVAGGGIGLAAMGLAMAFAAPAQSQPVKYPAWLFERSLLQAQNCGYAKERAVEDLIRHGTPPGAEISCYFKMASAVAPDIYFELKVPASGASLEIAVSMMSLRTLSSPPVVKRHAAFDSLACADAAPLARYLLERIVYDGDRYLPMPKVSGCRIDQASYAATPPFLTPFGYRYPSPPNARPVQRRSIVYAVSVADLNRGLPAHLKRKN